MRSNYRPLRNYIQEVEERNTALQDLPLMGLSVSKVLFPTIANLVGTDMSTYKIVYRNQFTYIADTSRRGDKIAIALNDRFDKMLVSQAYTPFEVTKPELLPEYLMMWFRRPEFDRYARFMSHGSAREIFSWEEMCNTKLPVPSIAKQREIVAEYNIIQSRIKANQHLIQKLEATAQTIYKQWFVDFEFPNEEGKPYKSSGGEMDESELGEIPRGWRVGRLSDVSTCLDYKRRPLSELERREFQGPYPYYGAMSIVDYVKEYIFDGDYVLFSEDGVNVIDEKGHPAVSYVWGKFWVNNHAHILQGKDGYSSHFVYMATRNCNVSHLVTGAAQPKINQENMNSIQVVMPPPPLILSFQTKMTPIFSALKNYADQKVLLIKMERLLLSKLATIEN